MKAVIKISMDNAAFEDNYTELVRILRGVISALPMPLSAGDGWNLRDINGNTVGTFKIIK